MFYRRLEFGATVREPSHYLNASRAPMPPSPDFSGVFIAGARTYPRTRQEAQAPVRSAILGAWEALEAAWCALGGTAGSWEAFVLPGRL